jgi:heme oxygenase
LLDPRAAITAATCTRALQWLALVPRSWMIDFLVQQTARYHATADADRLSILEKPTAERYRTYLARIYGFESIVETAFASTPGIDRRIVRTHMKRDRLAADLAALGAAHVAPARTPRLDTPAVALAWLWVLQRNTLLHSLIHRYLAGKLPDDVAIAGKYLAALEGRAGAAMRELGDAMSATARRVSLAEQMAQAAADAFRAQHQWYDRELVPPQQTPRPIAPRTAA